MAGGALRWARRGVRTRGTDAPKQQKDAALFARKERKMPQAIGGNGGKWQKCRKEMMQSICRGALHLAPVQPVRAIRFDEGGGGVGTT